jgi:molybdate transport system substrate-binding protein
VKIRIAAAALSGLLLVIVAVCAYYRPGAKRSETDRTPVRLAAAADLRFALNELIRRFEERHHIVVNASYGSSGTLYAQLLNEAPFDMFLSADIEYPRRLAARHLTVPDSEFTYAIGRLVAWVPSSSTLDVGRRGLEVIADPSVAHVAIANPEHAPYGRAAVEAMQAAGVYETVKRKLVFGENVEQALQFAQTEAADVGIVALSLAVAPTVRAHGRYVDIPLNSYAQITQGGAILRWAADLASARAFRAFLISREGRAVLEAYGFFLPQDQQSAVQGQLHSVC